MNPLSAVGLLKRISQTHYGQQVPDSKLLFLLQSAFPVASHRETMQLKEIASHLKARLEPSDAEADITAVATIESASPGEITFIANPRYASAAKTTQASAIIVDESF